ncbi:Rha family transcriptional regulator [Vibrio sp. Of7-15]|uniref:Rha family transcriptional regulator n=1 Tax=Vibrio sp. Of7-15 TaxID=2724879 RepID=UPI001EF29EBD|nr:Rha family transcriptional regulator [Vibrio sp. Of7-15]MCG7499357.1 Rha family transcriptional regulator [Vibrio sp. Of7-15]
MTNQITITLDSSDLVFEHSGELVTTSKLVSQAFGRRHNDVCRSINKLDCSEDFRCANYFAHPKKNEQNGESYTLWEMTKDGFMFLVMGFNGKKAAAIKEAYINAFNQMASKLLSNLPTFPPYSTPQFPNQRYPNFYDSGWIPALYRRSQSESHWTYHIKFNVRPKGGKFSATFELGIGGKDAEQPQFSSSGAQFVDSNFYLEYRDLDELWEYIEKVLRKYGANCPF